MQLTAPCVNNGLSRWLFVRQNRSSQSGYTNVQRCSSLTPFFLFDTCLPLSQQSKPTSLRCQATLLDVLAFVPGVCFDRQCQEAADRAFLIVTAVPLLGLLVAIILRLRPASSEKLGSEQVAKYCHSAFCQLHASQICSLCCHSNRQALSFLQSRYLMIQLQECIFRVQMALSQSVTRKVSWLSALFHIHPGQYRQAVLESGCASMLVRHPAHPPGLLSLIGSH